MAHQTRLFRRQVYRIPPARHRYLSVRRPQVRRVLKAFLALYREEGR